jgi:hypothetical protein
VSDVQYALHQRSQVDIAADPQRLFALLDDHQRLADHMRNPSAMMLGASMQFETDARRGQAVGSVIRMSGRVLGLRLAVEEIVVQRDAPLRKTWETIGEPRLLVIGAYRMGFAITPTAKGSRLVVFIDYRLPRRGVTRGLGLLLGRAYAAWCTRRMATDAAAAFALAEAA